MDGKEALSGAPHEFLCPTRACPMVCMNGPPRGPDSVATNCCLMSKVALSMPMSAKRDGLMCSTLCMCGTH